jgi:hypothetical protein
VDRPPDSGKLGMQRTDWLDRLAHTLRLATRVRIPLGLQCLGLQIGLNPFSEPRFVTTGLGVMG